MSVSCETILNGIADLAVLYLDEDGDIKQGNKAVETVTGYTPAELLNKSFSLLYTTEIDQQPRVAYELEMAGRQGNYSVESFKRRKDGTEFWCEMTLSAVAASPANSAGFVCLIKDRSRAKKQEQELRKREENYRTMVEEVTDYGIFMLDKNGYIQTWNEGAHRIKGYNSFEIIGKHFSIFYTKEDLEIQKPANELRIAEATGKYEEEGWRVRKDGSLFWANVVITALFNSNNQLIGFSKVTRDLSERRQAEDLLRQSEERYRMLVEQVVDYGIFMLDERGRIVSWNEGASRINQYSSKEIIGKYFSIFYTEEDKINNKPANELRIARETGKYEEEGWRVRKDGSLFWANVVITALTVNGVLLGYSKVTRDLTERKQAERALKESYESYKMLANELKITNADLALANQELEQFTSIVSHDLQEPVRTIKSFLQLIDMKLGPDAPADLRTYIAKAIAGGNRMKDLINNLLHYSQLSKEEISFEEINVAELISEVLQNMKSAIEQSGAHIDIDTQVATIRGNRVQLMQVVQNLLSNALKFTDANQPKIRIGCRIRGNAAEFSITDNGIGIAKSDQQKVFEIFRRLHTKKDYPGTGIGLAICKKIIERHQGDIWPESEPGKGTTFYFTVNQKHQAHLESA
jgi:PAS domain S-box-containing protein